MKTRRYIPVDGGLTDDGNGWNQLSAEEARRVAGKRIDEREQRCGNQGWQFDDGNDLDDEQGRSGSGEFQRREPGGAVDGYVGRAHDEGSGAAGRDRGRNVQRFTQRGGGQDGRGHAELARDCSHDCGRELCRVLEAATLALAHLDSDALSELERRALTLQVQIERGARIAAVPEAVARHRVFRAVVAATGESLGVLGRAGSSGLYSDLGMRNPWAR